MGVGFFWGGVENILELVMVAQQSECMKCP